MSDRLEAANAIEDAGIERDKGTVIKLEHMRDRPPRFAHLWKTADVGSVFRFSGALDGFANPLASARVLVLEVSAGPGGLAFPER